jgi:DNA modification methylase
LRYFTKGTKCYGQDLNLRTPAGKDFPSREARPAGQTLILSPSPLTWLGYRSPIQYETVWHPPINHFPSNHKSKSVHPAIDNAMQTKHTIILGNSQKMGELADGCIHLMLTSPPYPMIAMWDQLFKADPKIEKLWRNLDADVEESTLRQIYDAMHECLEKVWVETYRVLCDGGIAAINIGDATRSIAGKFQLFPNHSRITEICEKIGFTSLPYILWKKPTNKPSYKGKGAFLGSGFLPPNAYVTLDCEFILLFRKGKLRKFQPHDKKRYDSIFTKKQRDEWFSQIWTLKGTRQTASELERRTAAYPEEIARRLINMFSVKGETVLDPFLGSGTTTKIAMLNDRNSVGYEVDRILLKTINKKVEVPKDFEATVAIIDRDEDKKP